MRPFSTAALPTFGLLFVVGTASGLLRAAATLSVQRYAELDMQGLVLWTVEHAVLGGVLSLWVVAAGAVLLCLALDVLAERRSLFRIPPAFVPLVALIGVAVFMALNRLERLPLIPTLRSVPGLALAAGMVAASVAGLLGAWRLWPGPFARLAQGITAFHPRRLAPLFILVALLPVGRAVHDRVVGTEGLNVVLITVDTLRPDRLGIYGGQRNTSPNLDALARSGVRFQAAVAQWPKTTPSLVSMMNGTYGSRNGIVRKTRQRVPPRHVMLPELLREAGYRCVAVVTNPNLGEEFGFAQGFDLYRQLWRGWSRSDDSQRAGHVSDRAIDWLRREGTRNGKFFLWLHYIDAHAPYRPPAPYDRMFVGDRWYRSGTVLSAEQDQGGELRSIPREALLGTSRDPAYYISQYDGAIRYVDTQIGRVLHTLDDLGLSRRTLVVFTADHGESLGEHDYWFQHGKLPYDDCLRVPLVLHGPGLGLPRTVTAPVELIRLLPTILDYAGLPPSPQAQSTSLLPLLRDPRLPWPTYAYAEAGYAPEYQRIQRGSRWKLVLVPSAQDRADMSGTTLELYDLAHDPREEHNLVLERPDVARAMARELMGWIDTAGAKGSAVGETVEIDEVTEAQLRSLGYVR